MSKSPRTQDSSDDFRRLALRPKDAARALGIGTRLLWTLTNQNLIPHTRLGRTIIYPVQQLEKWLSDRVDARGGGG